MNDRDLISVIVPSFNHENYILATLNSIANQTHKNIQLIIIDDGSSDKSVKVIQCFLDAHKHRFTRPIFMARSNKGLPSTLNEAITISEAEFVCLIASDDILLPDALSVLLSVMHAKPKLGLAIGDAHFIDAKGEMIIRKTGGKEYSTFVQYFTRNRYFYNMQFDLQRDFGTYESLLGGNYLPIGPLIRKSVYSVIGHYDTNMVYEDYDFWVRLAKHYSMQFIDRPLAEYRMHDTNSNNILYDAIKSDRIKIHIREKPYSLEQGHTKAWSLKLVELLIGSIARRNWSEFYKLIKHAQWGLFIKGSGLFIRMLVCRALVTLKFK